MLCGGYSHAESHEDGHIFLAKHLGDINAELGTAHASFTIIEY